MVNTCLRCSAAFTTDQGTCPSCGSAVEMVGPEDSAASRPSLAEELLARLREATAGEFEVLGEIGRGGMARVYLAHEVILDRQVALKVLSPLFSEYPEIVRRFQHEARTAGQLSHPNIVPVFAVYQRAGLSFFSMPYVAGVSLRKLLRDQGALGIEETIGYILQAAAGLAYAHDNGVVHRDVKPENMLLEDPHGRLTLTDFGLAKALGGEALTLPGDMIGTPQYMSPEQCETRTEVDGRSDQYSLALVAYELLVGSHPFGELGFRQLMMKQLNEDPAPLEEKRSDVPPGVAAAIRRALSKDRTRRFPSIYSFAGALTGANIPARAASPRRKASALASSNDEVHTLWMRDRLKRAHKRRHSMLRLAGLGRAGLRNLQRLRRGLDGRGRFRNGIATKSALAVVVFAIAVAAIARRGDPREITESAALASSATGSQLTFRDLAMGAGRQTGELAGPPVERGDPATARAASVVAVKDPRPRPGRSDGGRPTPVTRSPPRSGQASSAEQLRTASAAADRRPGDRGGTEGSSEGSGEAGLESGRGMPSAAAQLTALLEEYRLALEGEDFEALSGRVYRGEIPSADLKMLRSIFDNADELEVELEAPDPEIDGDRAQMRKVEHRMHFIQARDRRERSFNLKLTLIFERGDAGWRLTRIKR